MWGKVCGILLALALLGAARAQPTLYVMGWVSALPVQLERVEVRSGALVQVLTSGDGLSGTIAATSERECVTIIAEGLTTTGAGVRFVRSWEDGCARLWLPVASYSAVVAQTPGGP